MSEHNSQDELEERADVVDRSSDVEDDDGDSRNDGEPWAKTSSGDADKMTND